ncbi:alpha/beta hydrolase [Halocatena pleomorpha]|uniref:Alpha/beta hydrolase n=1 Tax=Halocatena pleomorpha TaxID=1785090 RepID=A0A3P3R9V3_9EURY|nr:alpha/beta hydrolase [Halocatena pleomorpha]RRJ30261.1 alpha/beta hydrolase [Halocatena pleomorpha]
MRGELDPQVDVILELVNDYDITLSGADVSESRQELETMIDLAGDDPVSVGEVADFTIDAEDRDLPARAYVPEGEGPFPVVAFFHGGGFVLGSVDAYDNLCRLLARESSCLVVSVEYRLAPEHPWPAALEDCYAATRWLSRNADRFGGDSTRLAVAGDSAGGNLSATVSLLARERGMIDINCQILLYPSTASFEPMDSRAANASGYFLTAEDLVWFVGHYIEDSFDAHNPLAFPLQARDLSELPPAFVLTCGFDPLRDEGIAYADRLRDAGVDVEHTNYESMIHGFLTMEGIVDRAREGIDEVATYLQRELHP